jgi:hypothetical protein
MKGLSFSPAPRRPVARLHAGEGRN